MKKYFILFLAFSSFYSFSQKINSYDLGKAEIIETRLGVLDKWKDLNKIETFKEKPELIKVVFYFNDFPPESFISKKPIKKSKTSIVYEGVNRKVNLVFNVRKEGYVFIVGLHEENNSKPYHISSHLLIDNSTKGKVDLSFIKKLGEDSDQLPGWISLNAISENRAFNTDLKTRFGTDLYNLFFELIGTPSFYELKENTLFLTSCPYSRWCEYKSVFLFIDFKFNHYYAGISNELDLNITSNNDEFKKFDKSTYPVRFRKIAEYYFKTKYKTNK